MSTINNSLAVQERVVFVENNRNDLSFNTLETFGYGIEFDGMGCLHLQTTIENLLAVDEIRPASEEKGCPSGTGSIGTACCPSTLISCERVNGVPHAWLDREEKP